MVKWISHRGESIEAPENTAAAFRLAVSRGTDGMETDIHLTADNVLVCCHDSDTIRTCGGESMIIENSTIAQLETLDASMNKMAFLGEKIPRFSETLQILGKNQVYYVEIKENDPRVIHAMIDEIDRSKVSRSQVVMISFHRDIVRTFKEAYPELKALWLTSVKRLEDNTLSQSPDELIETLRQLKADGVDIHGSEESIDPAYVEAVKSAGYLFAVWTVDRVDEARHFIHCKVDAITSNCAAYLRMKIEKQGNS